MELKKISINIVLPCLLSLVLSTLIVYESMQRLF